MSFLGSIDDARKAIKMTNPYTHTPGETSPVRDGGDDGGGGMDGGGIKEPLKRPHGLPIKQSAGASKMRRTYGVNG